MTAALITAARHAQQRRRQQQQQQHQPDSCRALAVQRTQGGRREAVTIVWFGGRQRRGSQPPTASRQARQHPIKSSRWPWRSLVTVTITVTEPACCLVLCSRRLATTPPGLIATLHLAKRDRQSAPVRSLAPAFASARVRAPPVAVALCWRPCTP